MKNSENNEVQEEFRLLIQRLGFEMENIRKGPSRNISAKDSKINAYPVTQTEILADMHIRQELMCDYATILAKLMRELSKVKQSSDCLSEQLEKALHDLEKKDIEIAKLHNKINKDADENKSLKYRIQLQGKKQELAISTLRKQIDQKNSSLSNLENKSDKDKKYIISLEKNNHEHQSYIYKLLRSVDQLESDFSATISSWRWKTGNFLIRIAEMLLLRKKALLAVDHMKAIFSDISELRKQQLLVQRYASGNTLKVVNRNSKLIVYTCIFGDYDQVKEPVVFNENVEYLLFTDSDTIVSKNWKVVTINDKSRTLRRTSRLPKILPHRYLPKHDVSLYIDGTLELKYDDIAGLVDDCLNGHDVALYRHYKRNCIYDEGVYCAEAGKSTFQNVLLQFDRYRNDGFPEQYGLFENAFIVRRNTDQIRKLNELWWNEYESGEDRDQFSFMYSLWKLGIEANSIKIGKQFRYNKYVNFKDHSYLIYKDKNGNLDGKIEVNSGWCPDFSFVSALYNKEETINEFVAAIYRQDYKGKIEIIFVDDVSTDNSTNIVEKLQNKYLCDQKIRIVLLKNDKNIGNCGSRNRGISVARGENICIIDADCIVNRFFVINHELTHERGYDICIGPMGVGCVKENLQSLSRALDGDEKLLLSKMKLQFPQNKELFVNCVTRNFSLSRKTLNRMEGDLFDEDFAYRNHPESGFGWEDVEMGYRLYKLGAKIGFQNSAYTIHLDHLPELPHCVKAKGSVKNFHRLIETHPDIISLAEEWSLLTAGKIHKWLDGCGYTDDKFDIALNNLFIEHCGKSYMEN